MFKKLIFIISFVLIANFVMAQRYEQYVQFERRAQQLMKFTMDTLYIPSEGVFRSKAGVDNPPHSTLLPLAAVLQGGLEMEGILRGPSYTSKTVAVINKYFNTQLTPAAFQQYPAKAGPADRFFADNGYIAFTYTQKFARTGDELFSSRAGKIYQYLLTGLVKDKGMMYKEDDPSAISTNATAATILTAIGLHTATKEPGYLKAAQDIYNVAKKNLRSANGVYFANKNLTTANDENNLQASANGAMLLNAVLLYGLTRDSIYSYDAKQLAEAAYKSFNPSSPTQVNNAWGNSLLLRGYYALYAYEPNKKYLQAFYQYLLQERANNYRNYDLQSLGAVIEMNAVMTQVLRRESF